MLYIMFTRNSSSLQRINLNTNFKCVKKMDSQISNFDYSWQHDLFTKLCFIKFLSPKHVIFERSCKLHHIPYLATTNCLWLPSITIFMCNQLYGGPIDMRTMCWTIFHAFGFGSYMSWISFPNDILVEFFAKYYASQSLPHMTFFNLSTKYALDLKVVACCLTIHQGEFAIPNLL